MSGHPTPFAGAGGPSQPVQSVCFWVGLAERRQDATSVGVAMLEVGRALCRFRIVGCPVNPT